MTQAPEDYIAAIRDALHSGKVALDRLEQHIALLAQVVKAAREAEEKLTEDIRILELPGGDFHQYYQGLHGSTCGGCRMLRELRARRDALRESLSLLDQEPSESG